MGKVALQTKAQMVNVNRNCKSRGCGTKDECLTSGDPTHISKRKKSLQDMVEKGLERESDEVIVGNPNYVERKTEGLKRFIVQIVTKKIVYEPEIGWI